MPEVAIAGRCARGWERVREVFERHFAAGEEIGAAVAIYRDGEPVVDLWGGHADQACTRPWQESTIVNVYSCTKAMTALCAQRLVAEGRLDLDAPVARYWPEFAQAAKAEIPVRWLLSHRAALPAVRPLLPGDALYDWGAMAAALAAHAPWWTPGTRHGYHAVTFGWLVGEVVRRVSGHGLGTYFRETIARPLGLDFHIGLDDAEHHRVAEMSAIPGTEAGDAERSLASVILGDPEGMAARAFLNPPSLALGPNTPAWRRAEIPGANGHGTARDLARVYGALARGGAVDGTAILDADGVARCHAEQVRGPDLVLGVDTRFGQGFMMSQRRRDAEIGRGARAFGHPGAGGSLGFADPDAGLGFGYVMNRMGPHILLDPRAIALVDAAYACLA